jgi:hypothetical protein
MLPLYLFNDAQQLSLRNLVLRLLKHLSFNMALINDSQQLLEP